MFQICSLDLLILLILIAGKGKCPSKPQWDFFRTIESKDTWVGRDTPGSLKSISWPCEGSPQEWCHMPESTLWMLLEILQVWCHNPFLGECLPVPSHTVDEEPFTKSPIYNFRLFTPVFFVVTNQEILVPTPALVLMRKLQTRPPASLCLW